MTELQYESSRLLDGEILLELGALSGPDGEDQGLLKTLVTIFEATAEETLENIRTSAAAAEMQRFAEGVHKLKGSSGSIGAAALYDCCKAVDLLYKTKQLKPEDMGGFSEAIGRELVRAKVALEDYVRRSSTNPASPAL